MSRLIFSDYNNLFTAPVKNMDAPTRLRTAVGFHTAPLLASLAPYIVANIYSIAVTVMTVATMF